MISISLLGPLRIQADGRDPPPLPLKAQAMLAYLASHAGKRVSRERIAGLLWEDSAEHQAQRSLRQALVTVRKALGEEAGCALCSRNGGLLLAPERVEIDLVHFERAARSPRRDELERCPALYRGELLADFRPVSEAFDEWKLGESARVAALAVTTFKRLASIQAEAGDLAAAIALAQRLVGFDPLREDAHRLLMRLFVEDGRRAEALRQFAACAEILERELSIAPDAETAALAQSIRQNASISGIARWPESDIPAAATAPAANRVIAAVPPAPWPIAHWSPLAEGGFDAVRLARAGASRKAPAVPGRRRLLQALIAAICVVATVALIASARRPFEALRSVASGHPSFTVLPFTDVSAATAAHHVIDGLADTLRLDLRRLRGASVLPRPGTELKSFEETLRADYLVEGSVAIAGEHLRINSKLIDRDTGEVAWAGQFDVLRRDVLQVEKSILNQIAAKVGRPIEAVVSERTVPGSSEKAQAVNLAMLARFQTPAFSRDSNAAVRRLYRTALDLDPENIDARVGLAGAEIAAVANSWLAREALASDETVLAQALEIHPQHVPALYSRCELNRALHRYREAIAACRAVLDINPWHASSHKELGYDLLQLGADGEAIAAFKAANALAPTSSASWTWLQGLGWSYLLAGRDEEAIRWLRRAIEQGPGSGRAHAWLAAAYELTGRHREAQDEVAIFRGFHPQATIGSAYFRFPAPLDGKMERVLTALRSAGIEG